MLEFDKNLFAIFFQFSSILIKLMKIGNKFLSNSNKFYQIWPSNIFQMFKFEKYFSTKLSLKFLNLIKFYYPIFFKHKNYIKTGQKIIFKIPDFVQN